MQWVYGDFRGKPAVFDKAGGHLVLQSGFCDEVTRPDCERAVKLAFASPKLYAALRAAKAFIEMHGDAKAKDYSAVCLAAREAIDLAGRPDLDSDGAFAGLFEPMTCPSCEKSVHTVPAEGVPGQALRACPDCGTICEESS